MDPSHPVGMVRPGQQGVDDLMAFFQDRLTVYYLFDKKEED